MVKPSLVTSKQVKYMTDELNNYSTVSDQISQTEPISKMLNPYVRISGIFESNMKEVTNILNYGVDVIDTCICR